LVSSDDEEVVDYRKPKKRFDVVVDEFFERRRGWEVVIACEVAQILVQLGFEVLLHVLPERVTDLVELENSFYCGFRDEVVDVTFHSLYCSSFEELYSGISTKERPPLFTIV
jgi:hypothetical protein